MAGDTPPAWLAGPPTRPRRGVRWGIPDAALVWIGGIVGSVIAVVIALMVTGRESGSDDPVLYAAAAAGQYVAMLLALFGVSRAKGRGSLAADFGLRLDLGRDWWVLAAGAGLQIAANVMTAPILLLADRHEAAQEVVQRLEDSGGLELAVTVVAAALFAPVIEELLFRGLLLRALQRRMTPPAAIGVSAVVFGAVHLVDPNAYLVVPGLVAVGLVSGALAVRSGDLSRSILLHMGFNLIVVVATLSAGAG